MRLAITLCLLCCVCARADIYRWTDADGRVHYGDKPPRDARAKPVTAPVNTVAAPPAVKQQSAKPVAARAPVKIYTAQWCGYCRKARAQLNARRVPFQEIDVEASESGRREFRDLGARGVPVILVGERRMNGFDAQALDALLSGAGY